MLLINTEGEIIDLKITNARSKSLEKGEMKKISGIIVHQTGAATAKSTLESYKRATANGAHFLIDKDGTIYQTASIYKQTWHVGKLKARCLVEKRCRPVDVELLKKFNPARENAEELKKSVPDRYPSNQDSIGIEIVGAVVGQHPEVFEAVSKQQNVSLQWLVTQLLATLQIKSTEVFRHPEVSRKNITEASTAQW